MFAITVPLFLGLLHPASRTVLKFTFKMETHKLTLHIKGMYLVFLEETVHSICLTLSLVYQPNHSQRENHSKAGRNDLLEIPGALCKAPVLLQAQEVGGMQSHPMCRAIADANHPFERTPEEPEQLSAVCTAGSGSVSTNVHPHSMVTAHLHGLAASFHKKPVACRNTTLNITASGGADDCMLGYVNTSQAPHLPALPVRAS